MYRTEFWTLWKKARMGCFKRTALKHVYYLGWNRSPAQAGCMRQVLGPGALGRPRGIGWRGRWEGVLGWGIHVNPWLIHVNIWQNPLQYCKVISLQLIKKKKYLNLKKKKKEIHSTIYKIDKTTRIYYIAKGTIITTYHNKVIIIYYGNESEYVCVCLCVCVCNWVTLHIPATDTIL